MNEQDPTIVELPFLMEIAHIEMLEEYHVYSFSVSVDEVIQVLGMWAILESPL